jgi:hypothetical protein
MDTLNEAVIVLTQLQYMHDIMFHHHVDNIIFYASKNKVESCCFSINC